MYKCTGILESFSLVGGLFAFLQLHLLYTYHHNNHHRHHTIMYTRISYYNTHTHFVIIPNYYNLEPSSSWPTHCGGQIKEFTIITHIMVYYYMQYNIYAI